MRGACQRAVEIGLDGVAFTEHVDFGTWAVLAADLTDYPHLRRFVAQPSASGDPVGGMLHPPPLDVNGYQRAIEESRDAFPSLNIVAGIEVGEPHWYRAEVRDLIQRGGFERVLGSHAHVLGLPRKDGQVNLSQCERPSHPTMKAGRIGKDGPFRRFAFRRLAT